MRSGGQDPVGSPRARDEGTALLHSSLDEDHESLLNCLGETKTNQSCPDVPPSAHFRVLHVALLLNRPHCVRGWVSYLATWCWG